MEGAQHWQNAVRCQRRDSKMKYVRTQSTDRNTKYAVSPVDAAMALLFRIQQILVATMAVLLFEIQQILVQRIFFIQKEFQQQHLGKPSVGENKTSWLLSAVLSKVGYHGSSNLIICSLVNYTIVKYVWPLFLMS